jgi:hypothetical protein
MAEDLLVAQYATGRGHQNLHEQPLVAGDPNRLPIDLDGPKIEVDRCRPDRA